MRRRGFLVGLLAAPVAMALILAGCSREAHEPIQSAREVNSRPDAHWEVNGYPILVCNDSGEIIAKVTPTGLGWQVHDGTVRHPEFSTQDKAKRYIEHETVTKCPASAVTYGPKSPAVTGSGNSITYK